MQAATTEHFIEESTAGAQFGDARLAKRLARVLRATVAAPSATFPNMASSDGELEGTYRFLSNDKVSADAILKPHFAATTARVARADRVVVAHDSTQISFGPIARGDLERIGRGTTYGFNAHVSFAVTAGEERIPLGALALSTYNRPFGKARAPRSEAKNDDTNVTLRWQNHVRHVRELIGDARNVIHVMDREADDYDLMASLVATNERFVIRQATNRRLSERAAEPKVRTVVAATPFVVARSVKLSPRRKPTKKKHATRQPLRRERTAFLDIRATSVTIPRTSSARDSTATTLTLNLVEVIERNPPTGEEPIEWWLWTTEPIDSGEQLLDVIDAYRARWAIEELFKALKSGCRIEERQLESRHALENALALFVPVAWRLLLLRTLSRATPDAPASLTLTSLQVRALRGFMLKKRNVELAREPTAREAMLAVAAMGGHIPNNGDPGWMVLGRGFDRLLDVELGLSIALTCDQ